MRTRRGFRQADLVRALKGARAAGYEPLRVELGPGGNIRLEFVTAAPHTVVPSPSDEELDRELAELRALHGEG